MAKRLSATHHARWMGACLYILKMLLCMDHFKLSPKQQSDVLMHAYYIIYIHFFFWFSCQKMADAPLLTLLLHHDLQETLQRIFYICLIICLL